MESMAALGRQAVAAVMGAAKLKHEPDHYVNKTEKYVSVKILTDHLTPKQIARVELRLCLNPRFLKVYNGTAELPSRAPWHPGSANMTQPKVMVRFAQGRSVSVP